MVTTVISPEDARQKTEQLLQKGADLIKIAIDSGAVFMMELPVLSPEEARSIVKVAHQHGTVVTAQVATQLCFFVDLFSKK